MSNNRPLKREGSVKAFKDAYIPYGGYWSTPFCSWQGSFQNLHSIKFAAEIGQRFLQENKILPKEFDELIFGMTIPQPSAFYGTPWLAGMMGADHITGPMIGQACATGARCVELAALGIESGLRKNVLVMTHILAYLEKQKLLVSWGHNT